MVMSSNKTVLLGVCGSIAAYRAAELVRLMRMRDWAVRVVMTRGATKFVSELTFRTLSQNPVGLDPYDGHGAWRPEHISAGENIAALVVAPCTANVLAKLANGLADDLLSCTALATTAPLVIAPAMNVNMWHHPATQANVKTLKNRGATFLDVASGDLACGYQGEGRLAALADIMDVLIPIVESKGTS